ncbi:hypothetical protein PyrSV_gp27 [Pyrobaculum spherical virus]|uniref:Uncharacterized protein n=1 Tax=Pyrobaculum spherical virus (isolate United States/Yellowstone) TaxID=654907 RepID=Q6ZYH6_PSVY|nr:hypothetical protein PyrSV_gp27 [Pyrobaculum spherical virus]CAG25646.1 hypothetical protein [Pyrobaculum spherical virus]
MHIQTVLKTVLEAKRRDYYGVVLKAAQILEEEDLCKMAALVVAIVTYRKGTIDPVIVDFAAKCLNKYPNLIHAFTRIGVNPPGSVAGADSAIQDTRGGGKEPIN